MTPRDTLASLFHAWRDGDALRASAHFTADATYQEAKHEAVVGREAIVAHFVRFFRDGPQFEFNVDDVIIEGDKAAVGYRFRIEAFGATWIEKPGCALVRFNEGAIAEWREFEG